MNRVLSILAAACCMAANVGAAPVPNHQQPQVKNSAIPMALRSAQNQTQKSSKAEPKPYQVGTASWYGKQFHGKTTASGVRFDMKALVAAHPTWPFGTLVRVTNLANGRAVRVRVIDRGPAAGPRAAGVLIDLSYRAAETLRFIADGRARVRLEVLRWGK